MPANVGILSHAPIKSISIAATVACRQGAQGSSSDSATEPVVLWLRRALLLASLGLIRRFAPSNSGSLAIFAGTRRAMVSTLAWTASGSVIFA